MNSMNGSLGTGSSQRGNATGQGQYGNRRFSSQDRLNNTASEMAGLDEAGNRGEMWGGDKIQKGYKAGAIQQYTPEMMELFQKLLPMLGEDSWLYKMAMGDQEGFDEMEAPAMRKFQELQGQMGSRFSGMGMGARRGSGFQNTANQATNDFAMNLASNRQEMKMNALKELQGMSNSLLGQRPIERTLTEKPKSWWESAAPAFAGAAGNAAGKAATGG